MTESKKWILLLNEFESSGLGKQKFCKKKKISHHQLYYWMKKLRPELISTNNAKTNNQEIFIPLDKPAKNKFNFILSNGMQISFDNAPDPSWVAKMIQLLGTHHDKY